ncbi:MAG: hypothetical protein WEA61_08910 [Anaerolineales bacterium]
MKMGNTVSVETAAGPDLYYGRRLGTLEELMQFPPDDRGLAIIEGVKALPTLIKFRVGVIGA